LAQQIKNLKLIILLFDIPSSPIGFNSDLTQPKTANSSIARKISKIYIGKELKVNPYILVSFL